MSKKETTPEEQSENLETKKMNPVLRNILVFILFFAIGLGLGYIGASKYLKTTDEDLPVEETNNLLDITEKEDYQNLITSLLGILDNDAMFYTTKGISISTLDNTSKLRFLYEYIVKNNQYTTETLTSEYYGSTTCLNGFITDESQDIYTYSTTCTVKRINKSAFVDADKKLFNDDILDTSVNFSPADGTSCVVDNDSYICGNVTKVTNITGELISVFDVTKATKDVDGTIVIYVKGYLNDKRSNVNNPNDQYDNYYLHSSDSTDYYYELKSADNLTFKHTFRTTDGENYYYESTELVKE